MQEKTTTMAESSIISKIKSFWKWIASGIVAVGAATVAAVHWIGAGVVTTAGTVKTVAVATAIVSAATAFSFNFGDKGADIGQYAQEAFAMIEEGKDSEALEYTDKLIGKLDSHIEDLKKEASTLPTTQASDSEENDKEAIAAVEQKHKVIKNYLLQRQIMDVVKYQVLLKTGGITHQDWKEKICAVLKANPENSGRIIRSFLAMADEQVTAETVWGLLKNEVPINAKGELALWLANDGAPGEEATIKECEGFFGELLSYASDTESAPKILIAYTKELDRLTEKVDRRSAVKTTNDVLDTFITLFPDNELGITAAKLKLGAFTPGPQRDAKAVELVDKYPGTAIAHALLPSRTKSLLRKGEFKKALVGIDTNRMLATIKNEAEAADVLLRLAEKACTETTVSIPNRCSRGKNAKDTPTTLASSKKITPFSICVGMANQLYDTGDYSTAAELIFATLEKKRALPQNLITGQPLHKVSDFGRIFEPGVAKPVAQYLRAFVQYVMNTPEAGDMILEKMAQESLPEDLRPYVFHLLAKRAVSKKEYSAAISYADFAIEYLPTSPIIVSLKTEIDKAKQKVEITFRIEAQQKKHFAAAEAAETAEEAIQHYKKISELYLALNDVEQAIGTHLLIVEKFPENRGAPIALAESIRILKAGKKRQYAERVNKLIEKLVETYPDSDQAKPFIAQQAETTK